MDSMVFDNIVITAANGLQAEQYRKSINDMLVIRSIPEANYIIFCDRNCERVGSGGSTIDFIVNYYRKIDFKNKSTLLIHSGGDSKRVPQYSACGKLFAPVLKRNKYGYAQTLFNELIDELEHTFSNVKNGLVIASGDVLITNIDYVLSASDLCNDALSFSVFESVEKGSNHGVFTIDECGMVNRFLHKCDENQLISYSAVEKGKVRIDTGILYFGGHIIDELYSITQGENYDKFINAKTYLNLYGDIVYPLSKEASIKDFSNQAKELDNSPYIQFCRNLLFNSLYKYSIHNIDLGGEFVHFGTSKELLCLIENATIPSSEQIVCCNQSGDFYGYNSYISDKAGINGYIENSYISNDVKIPKNCIISGAYLEKIEIPDNTVVSVLKIDGGRYCARIYPVDYNPKQDDSWNTPLYPVYDDITLTSDYVQHFIDKTDIYDKCEKLSLCDSARHSCKNTELEKMIIVSKNDWFLRKIKNTIKINPKIKAIGKKVYIQLPARVNFAGGWTDTPPYTNEYGGTVLNAAIKINGVMPITCTINPIDINELYLISKDLNAKKLVCKTEDLYNFAIENDSHFIQQAALIACGIITPDTDLTEFLNKHGGFEIITEVKDIPKGNGLGTSSILCAAVAKAVYDYFSIEYDDSTIINTVLIMEQLMVTGGGWQDQIGGYFKGFKYTTCKPGDTLDLSIRELTIDKNFVNELESRYALIYSGGNHFSRNLLRKVMNNVFFCDETKSAIVEIKRLTQLMLEAVSNKDIDQIAMLFNRHFELSKMLYSGTSNDQIDMLIENISDLVEGVFICGAGGGGFLQIITKKNVSKVDIEKRLNAIYSKSNIQLYNVSFLV